MNLFKPSRKETPPSQDKKTFLVALVGNPNSGKTTLFNNLTGSRQRVGNYGGTTVETKEGILRRGDIRLRIVDLPGIYSLNAYSIEERVSRDFILDARPDAVVNVVDGGNLERNLYLSVQLVEMNVPLVVALNMADEIEQKGLQVNVDLLSRGLRAPVVSTVGVRRQGTEVLITNILVVATGQWQKPESAPIIYTQDITDEVGKIAGAIRVDAASSDLPVSMAPEWMALKLLEKDISLFKQVPALRIPAIKDRLETSRQRLTRIYGEDPESVIAESRYGYAHGMYRSTVQRSTRARIDWSDRIDSVLTHRLLGLPIFAMLMYLTFKLVFTLGDYPVGWLETAVQWLHGHIIAIWPATSLPLVRSMILEGIIAGVGGVMVFLPNIMLLFMAIALLEDSGYMARAAFLVDRLMKWVGLHGKSFIPMLLGFGCSVPGILGTRILDNRRDRLTTMLVLPLMSCGARLPIYLLIAPAFFKPGRAAIVVYAMYVIGIVLAIVTAKLLRGTMFRGEASPFVMELPPYRLPTLQAVLMHMWQRSWLYVKKAGTVILAISVLMWALMTFPRQVTDMNPTAPEIRASHIASSWAGRVGHSIEPAIKPLGFDWRMGTALLGAVCAKEVFVAQMGIIHAVGHSGQSSEALRNTLREEYTPLTGFCIMLFCLIASPCIATAVAVRKESGSWGWAALQWGGLTLLGYLLTLAVYQLGALLKLGTPS